MYTYTRSRQYFGYWCCAVAHYRKLAGLTQTELGDRVGLTKNSISAIELGQTVPSTKFALRISDTLRVSVDSLFWEEV